MSVGVLYNRIGKRIVGVGRNVGSGGESSRTIPNSYEMPRNTVDCSFAKKFGGHWEIRGSVRDILAEKVLFQQMATVNTATATKKHKEITREYRPGRNYNLSLSFNF